jgi:S1-C subfamily serine protease
MLGVLLDDERMVGGVDVQGTTPKGGAVQAGLSAGDKIIVINGIDLSQEDDPLSALAMHMKTVQPGESVGVTYLRGDEQVDTTIITQARSAHIFSMMDDMSKDFDIKINVGGDFEELHRLESMTSHHSSMHSDKLMAIDGDLAEYFGVDDGVLVIRSGENSELKDGDVLLEVGGARVESVDSAVQSLASIEAVAEIKVRRNGRSGTVEVAPDEFHSAVHKEGKVIKIIKD